MKNKAHFCQNTFYNIVCKTVRSTNMRNSRKRGALEVCSGTLCLSSLNSALSTRSQIPYWQACLGLRNNLPWHSKHIFRMLTKTISQDIRNEQKVLNTNKSSRTKTSTNPNTTSDGDYRTRIKPLITAVKGTTLKE